MMSMTVNEALGRLQPAREALAVLIDNLPLVQSLDLAEVAGLVSALAREASGLRLALAAEAHERGAPREAGFCDVVDWLQAADPHLPAAEARLARRVVDSVSSPPLAPVRDAVVRGAIAPRDAVDTASFVARMKPVVTAPSSGCGPLGPVEEARREQQLVDDALTLYAAGCTRVDVRRLEVELMARYAPDRLAIDAAADAERASMSAFARRSDGMYVAEVVLDQPTMVIVRTAIEALAAPVPASDGAPDPRPAGRRRADALVALAQGAAAADRTGPMGATARVLVTTTLDDLVARAERAGLIGPGDEVAGYGAVGGAAGAGPVDGAQDGVGEEPAVAGGAAVTGSAGVQSGVGLTPRWEAITPSALRAMCCDAEIVPVILDSRSKPLDVGRRSRLATRSQREALLLRDRGCTFPGCTAPPEWTQAHHIVHWSDGGRTVVSNLALLCGQHHRFVHHHDITGRVGVNGVRWDVVRSGGRWRPARPRELSAVGQMR